MKKFIAILICYFIGFNFITANAQPAKVDSILSLLRAAHKQGQIDTIVGKSLWPVMKRALLNKEDIQKIVAEANLFVTGDNQDMSINICYNILKNLIDADRNTAIDFGKTILEKTEKSKTPEKKFFRDNILRDLRGPYRNSNRLDEGIAFYNKYQNKFIEAKDSSGIAVCGYVLASFYRSIGLIDRAIYHIKKSLAYTDSNQIGVKNYFGGGAYVGGAVWRNNFGVLSENYFLKGDTVNGIQGVRLYLYLSQKHFNGGSNAYAFYRLAKAYEQTNRLDSAAYLIQYAYDSCKNNDRGLLIPIFQVWSLIELKKKNYNKADSMLVKAWEIIKEKNTPANSAAGIIDPDYYRALIRIEQKKYTEAADFLISDMTRINNLRNEMIRDYKMLAEVYDKMGDKEKSIKYYKAFINLQDSLLADQSKFSAISFEAEQQMNEKEFSINQLKSENKISAITRNFSIGIIVLVLALAGLIYYRYKSKQKANSVLEKTLTDLRSTQTQLIQSEKMASLGELTAGIAHEIQNPLNFVNNFSEVSAELVDEMNGEIEKGNFADVKLIGDDLKQNLEKINHHGKRADAIVKGMLQHSRSSSGQKEPTDINALCDEYLRLAYHGLRAKDNSFNASFETHFDDTIGKINIQPQEMGRVILNLINNAFYAVAEKKKQSGNEYKPTVTVSTKLITQSNNPLIRQSANSIIISIKDNGTGIPQKVVDKIFQPFFTTKPTGQGTGLGLSLSYDIVKAHGGELKVNTKCNEDLHGEDTGTEFTIQLPI